MRTFEKRVGVCSWSLQAESPGDLVNKIHRCGIDSVQLSLGPLLEAPAAWSSCAAELKAGAIDLLSGMMGCVGEDYSTIQRIKETGGVMNDETWPLTIEKMRLAAPLAGELGLKLVTFHAGFIPHEASSALFEKGVSRVREVASAFAEHGIAVALETGQEPAEALLLFLQAVNRSDVGVNFDPANMLLYGSGEPIKALGQLLPYIWQVHIKDAVASGVTGQWGNEVPAGKGQVDWPAFFQTLKSGGYSGPFVIEREAGGARVEDVRAAKELCMKAVGNRES
jgi:sugar phosphate isomerase/epimerase